MGSGNAGLGSALLRVVRLTDYTAEKVRTLYTNAARATGPSHPVVSVGER